MITPAPGITVLDGMATLAGLRGPGAERSVPQVKLAYLMPRTFDDRVDLSPGAREALARQGRQAPSAAGQPDSGVGRLVDVLA